MNFGQLIIISKMMMIGKILRIHQISSEQVKDEFFDAFSKSDAFKEIDHNTLLEALANPKKIEIFMSSMSIITHFDLQILRQK
ncbi:12475_t:CDS:2 [Funneliformis caledonium]|uniref:12475_t:CDS:1 n=1 Tax=Funneliformis caledonium TaxID=1117310 RepID=A0A9N9GKW1_9GLOM|nr:12475_t:CDS:2 [Funneliformis caledonium]